MKYTFLIILFFVVVFVLFTGGHNAFAQPNLELDYPGLIIDKTQPLLPQVISWAYRFALGIVGITALFVLVWAGIRYISSAGNPTAQSDAKQWITSALTGLALLLGSFLILFTINPNLTSLGIVNVDDLIEDVPSSEGYRSCISEEFATGGNISIAASNCGCLMNANQSEVLFCNYALPDDPTTFENKCGDNLCILFEKPSGFAPFTRICCPLPDASFN